MLVRAMAVTYVANVLVEPADTIFSFGFGTESV